MTKRFVFGASAGRTGTHYLSELLKSNLEEGEIFHEILGYDSFGLDTPDLSDLMLFNSQGNVAKVRDFWQRKHERILSHSSAFYAETSHILMKAGLLENIDMLTREGEVHIVALTRDKIKTIMSYRSRFDFFNVGNMWMWYLDPDYPLNMVGSKPLKSHGIFGIALWYLYEMEVRTEYYRMLFKDHPNVFFHDVKLEELSSPEIISSLIKAVSGEVISQPVIPEASNVGAFPAQASPVEMDALRQLVEGVKIDTIELAQYYVAKAPWFAARASCDGGGIQNVLFYCTEDRLALPAPLPLVAT